MVILRGASTPLSFSSPFLADYRVIRVLEKGETISREKLILFMRACLSYGVQQNLLILALFTSLSLAWGWG
jgi:hypothetical protein